MMCREDIQKLQSLLERNEAEINIIPNCNISFKSWICQQIVNHLVLIQFCIFFFFFLHIYYLQNTILSFYFTIFTINLSNKCTNSIFEFTLCANSYYFKEKKSALFILCSHFVYLIERLVNSAIGAASTFRTFNCLCHSAYPRRKHQQFNRKKRSKSNSA